MHCKCHRVSFKRGRSYIDSPDWIENKKSAINLINEDNKCFQYAATVALNYGEIRYIPERVANIEPFISKYYWEIINYPSRLDDWTRFEKNNPTSVLDILHTKEKKYYQCVFQTIIHLVKIRSFY